MDWGICRLMTQPAEPAPAPAAAGTADAAPRSPARTGSISRAEVSLEASHGETAYGAIVGTPLYMSPEQAQGRHDELDAKSDQCALGLILFELVALKRPLGGKTLAEVLHAGQRRDARAARRTPSARRSPASSARSSPRRRPRTPADRYASVAALADDLRRFLRGDAVLARPDSAWQRAVRCAGPASAGCGADAARAGHRHPRRRRRPALSAGARARGAGAARARRSSAWSRDVGEQGDRLQVSLLELHDALDMAVSAIGHAFEYGQPTHGADPLGRRLARRDHRLRHRARCHARVGRGRSAARRHRAGLGDPRDHAVRRPSRARQRRRPAATPSTAPTPACTSCAPASRAASSSRCRPPRSNARARRPPVRLVQGGERRPRVPLGARQSRRRRRSGAGAERAHPRRQRATARRRRPRRRARSRPRQPGRGAAGPPTPR